MERSAKSAMLTEVRRKTTLSFVSKFTRDHRAWLQTLADKYKSGNALDLDIFTLVTQYSKNEDKEVALLCSLLLSNNEHLLKQQETLYNILGKSPYQTMIRERGFVDLSIGSNQNRRIPGTFVLYWQISRLLSRIRDIQDEYGSIEDCITEILHSSNNYDPYYALTHILAGLNISQMQYKVNLLLMIMGTNNGIGLGLWSFPNYTILCPENKKVVEFLELWFPDYYECGLTFDKAVNALGLKNQTDFYYAYLGFETLKKVNAKEVKNYARRYKTLYENRSADRIYELKKIQPRIFFSLSDE